jgi:hypothetical protein
MPRLGGLFSGVAAAAEVNAAERRNFKKGKNKMNIEVSEREVEGLLYGLDNLMGNMIQDGDCVGDVADGEEEIFAPALEALKVRLLEGLPSKLAAAWDIGRHSRARVAGRRPRRVGHARCRATRTIPTPCRQPSRQRNERKTI